MSLAERLGCFEMGASSETEYLCSAVRTLERAIRSEDELEKACSNADELDVCEMDAVFTRAREAKRAARELIATGNLPEETDGEA